MKKLECKIGSITLTGKKVTSQKIVKQGEIFELADEARAKTLIEHGYAVEVPSLAKTAKEAKPAKPEAAPDPSAEVPKK